MRITSGQAGLLIVPLSFIFMLNAVWFHLKGHNPRNIPLFIPVIFHRKR
uniref:Uncharacterized protein n=1 Tax=Arundo donax TaxID=35708 RepID=A0A0A9D219_ARUDO